MLLTLFVEIHIVMQLAVAVSFSRGKITPSRFTRVCFTLYLNIPRCFLLYYRSYQDNEYDFS